MFIRWTRLSFLHQCFSQTIFLCQKFFFANNFLGSSFATHAGAARDGASQSSSEWDGVTLDITQQDNLSKKKTGTNKRAQEQETDG